MRFTSNRGSVSSDLPVGERTASGELLLERLFMNDDLAAKLSP